ncbi:protein ABHD14A-like [Centruroides vittatus]|uniref:protein ABHD14A-like n=1 Tax=Centruroides vittatus TaxID=120091 RepID=UPI003510CA5F
MKIIFPSKRTIYFLPIIIIYIFVLINSKKFSEFFRQLVEETVKHKEWNFNEVPPVSTQILIHSSDVDVKSYYVQVKHFNIYCLESLSVPWSEIKKHVLLLHGSTFSANTWEYYGTLQLLAVWGYRALAIDLPGYGRSSKEAILSHQKLEFFEELLRKLQVNDIVIVAPSISGLFAAPYVLKHSFQVDGLITLSSIFPSQMKLNDFEQSNVPILLIYGDRDDLIAKKMAEFNKNADNIWIEKLPNTGSNILQERTFIFHKLLYNFLRYLERNS